MILSNDGLNAFHYRSYGTFFLHKNRLHKIYRGFTHYKYYRANKFADLYNKLCSAEAYFDSYPSQIEEDAKFVSRIKLYTTKVAIEISDEILRLIGPLQKFDKVNIKRYLKDAETIENYGRSGNSIRREIAERWLKE
ncbi:hypothetical protein CYK11_08810 [Streptococcus anginosus]|nr:hypothetical protein [Streptococcus anginosus]KAA9302772.1 hypothetical protein F6I02_08795 [Streptococcus anginosus]OHO25872.1 hypothetical protein HMPREF2610_01255 [Streptococcus sp. HMSC034A12]PKZ99930.1 hypothetical protein CYK11_08810 [Streptococcus anginosus]WIK87110.1 hypothetical protein F6I26_004995 [Streptococcus anginosus]